MERGGRSLYILILVQKYSFVAEISLNRFVLWSIEPQNLIGQLKGIVGEGVVSHYKVL